jgi:phosphatidylserine decarboxylase
MIHKEGIKISAGIFIFLSLLNLAVHLLPSRPIASWITAATSLAFMIFILRFFRNPHRQIPAETGQIFAPADGKVVVVEETTEREYFKDRRIQISIFMSVWNVHINWFPAAGKISYYKYHPGKYLVARHPKSSLLNERNTVVIRTEKGTEILIRQIAGIVARRIVSYSATGKEIGAGDEMGFIRFGSRVDVFLPLGSRILVQPGQTARGCRTVLAEL